MGLNEHKPRIPKWLNHKLWSRILRGENVG